MARRRNNHEEHENHERWLVSYADFITLLFAFFVVMYAISQVNEGKYRVLSDSLLQAFKPDAQPIHHAPPLRISGPHSGPPRASVARSSAARKRTARARGAHAQYRAQVMQALRRW